jgi:hypothetical protein
MRAVPDPAEYSLEAGLFYTVLLLFYLVFYWAVSGFVGMVPRALY